jgi:hypothetical protein
VAAMATTAPCRTTSCVGASGAEVTASSAASYGKNEKSRRNCDEMEVCVHSYPGVEAFVPRVVVPARSSARRVSVSVVGAC